MINFMEAFMKNTMILTIAAFLLCITNVYATDTFNFAARLKEGWADATIVSVSSDSPKVLSCSKVTPKGIGRYYWTCKIDNTKKGDDPILDLHTTSHCGGWYPTIKLTECTWSEYAQRWLCKAKVNPGLGEAAVTNPNKRHSSFEISFWWATKK